jgi:hypothetical protein
MGYNLAVAAKNNSREVFFGDRSNPKVASQAKER